MVLVQATTLPKPTFLMIDQLVPFHRWPECPLTAKQLVALGHDTLNKEPESGLLAIDQFLPFQCSTRVFVGPAPTW